MKATGVIVRPTTTRARMPRARRVVDRRRIVLSIGTPRQRSRSGCSPDTARHRLLDNGAVSTRQRHRPGPSSWTAAIRGLPPGVSNCCEGVLNDIWMPPTADPWHPPGCTSPRGTAATPKRPPSSLASSAPGASVSVHQGRSRRLLLGERPPPLGTVTLCRAGWSDECCFFAQRLTNGLGNLAGGSQPPEAVGVSGKTVEPHRLHH